MVNPVNLEEREASAAGASVSEAQPSEAVATPLSDGDVRAAWDGETCAACGGAKIARRAFCPTDTAALTIFVRRALQDGPESAGFSEMFRPALRHLQLHTARKKRLPARAGEWSFTSDSELEAAGYRFLEHAQCGVPGCWKDIVWYRAPQGHRVAVGFPDYQPHRTNCANPDFFRQQRERKEQQRKERRAKKRAQTFARSRKAVR